MKVFFLDDEKNIIGIQYIYDVEEDKKPQWNRYEQILTVPENAKYMQFHIWARGEKEENGFLELENYSIIPYKDMIMVDNMFIFEGDSWNEFMKVKRSSLDVQYERVDTMKRNMTIENPENERALISFGESANPLWKESFDGKRVDLAINGIRGGFITDKDGDGSIEVVLRKAYYFGLALLGIGIIGSLILMAIMRKRKGEGR